MSTYPRASFIVVHMHINIFSSDTFGKEHKQIKEFMRKI